MVVTAAENRTDAFLRWVEQVRQAADARLEPARRVELGQFLSSESTARLVAGLVPFDALPDRVRLLDPGAGVGSLTAALVAGLCDHPIRPSALSVTACEVDAALHDGLGEVLRGCRYLCEARGIEFTSRVIAADFIETGVSAIRRELFSPLAPIQRPFDLVVMNPPYRKIGARTHHRALLSGIGVETSNLYTAFLAVAVELLRDGGELVAITPRSFCNGSYFRAFRRWFLDRMTLRHVHVFEARDAAFKSNGVLQENIVFRASRGRAPLPAILISTSQGPDDDRISTRQVEPRQVIHPGDPEAFIRLVPDANGHAVAELMGRLSTTLHDLRVSVFTGRVVDFRAAAYLRANPHEGTAPLIYPMHCRGGRVVWPRPDAKKPNAIVVGPATADLLLPPGSYVLVRRFSTKEEPRRVVAVVCRPEDVGGRSFAIENHLNFFHRDGHGLPHELAVGLATFLNSTVVDLSFRQFSGHTQVNANDLRSMKYPATESLERLGRCAAGKALDQGNIDRLIEQELAGWTDQAALSARTAYADLFQTFRAFAQSDRRALGPGGHAGPPLRTALVVVC